MDPLCHPQNSRLRDRSWSPAVAAVAGLVFTVLVFAGTLLLQRTAPNRAVTTEPGGIGLFQVTNVWRVHLHFAPEQWKAMEPEGGMGPFGGLGGPPGPGGLGGPGGPGRFGGFGPSLFIAPMFLVQGDRNADGQFSREEFTELGQKWFTAWDTNRSGKLDSHKIRAGLNATIAPPAGAPPSAPSGPGGHPPGMSLQGPEGRRNGLAAAMGIDFPSVQADLEIEGQRFPDVSVRYKGNGTFMQSRPSLKRSLKVDLNDGFPGRKLAGVTKLNFHNNVTDASWMNEVLSHRLFRDAGVPAPRTAYTRVCLTVPGQYDAEYLGLYSLVENVDNRFAVDRFGTKKGALFKPVTRQLFEDLGDHWAAYDQSYDPKTPLSDEETQRVIAFCKLVSHASDAEFAARLETFLDLDEFARFMAVTVWLSTMDSLLGVGQNFYVYLHPKTRQFQFIPWDLDHSFGQFTLVGTQEQRENLSIHRPWDGDLRFLGRVFQVDKFKRLYLARMKEFSHTIFEPERFHQQVDELAAILRPWIQQESQDKLARFDQVVAGQAAGPPPFGGGFDAPPFGGRRAPNAGAGDGEGGPRFGFPFGGPQPDGAGDVARPGFGPPGGFGQPPKPIKGFVTARAKSVNAQLAGQAEGTIVSRLGPGGFGGPPRPGTFGGQRSPGAPGGPNAFADFGPGMFLGPIFLSALDADRNGELTQAEFAQGFQRWFNSWNTNHSGTLTGEQLRAGIDQDLSPFPRVSPGPFGFGPPGRLPPDSDER